MNGESLEQPELASERRSRPPGAGERIAIGGYHPQYTVMAQLTLDALIRRELEAIRVADTEAGHLDDLQVVTRMRVDGYQVKWSRYGEPISFADLLRESSNGQPPLIRQLADGWRDGRRAYPTRRFVAHLRTSRRPSTNDNVADEADGARHFAAFLAEAWEPLHRDGAAGQVPPRWHAAIRRLAEVANLSEEEVPAFAQACELEFGASMPDEPAPEATAEALRWWADLQQLTLYLYGFVASPEQQVEVPVERLLADLGWSSRLELRTNDFRIDDSAYTPIGETEAELRARLDAFASGYLALLGTPGSGKSSLATVLLRSYPARSVRYYAFLPDAPDPASVRGEAATFLHDLVLQFDHAHLRAPGSLPSYEPLELRSQLAQQLAAAGRDYAETGRKTVVLVDGIDHIRRELRPARSLVDDLPMPRELPDGVLVLIGSQHLNDLPSRIRHQLESNARERIVEMRPLNRESVHRVVEKTLRPAQRDESLHDTLYTQSTGHPLALQYLLQQAAEAESAAEARAIVTSAPAYAGDIEQQYTVYWDEIRDDDSLVQLLGLLARLRGPIAWPVLTERFEQSLLDAFRRRTRHFFRREGRGADERWFFFHNSFRLFLLARSAEVEPGEADPERDRRFHRALAGWSAEAPQGSPLRWDRLFHLAAANDDEALIAGATQHVFRTQFLELRPLSAIEADLRLALRRATTARDIVALARLSLADNELSQREFYLDEPRLIRLLLGVGRTDIARARLRSGLQLGVNPDAALDLLPTLRRNGLDDEAAHVFALAEPLELLHRVEPVEAGPQSENLTLLRGWAREAPRYRGWQQTLEMIARLRLLAEPHWRIDDAQATAWLRRELSLEAAEQEVLGGSRDEPITLLEEWSTQLPAGRRTWVTLAADVIAVFGEDDPDLVEAVLRRAAQLELEPAYRLLLAESVLHATADVVTASELVASIDQPPLARDLYQRRDDFEAVEQRYRLTRLLRAIGQDIDADEVVPVTEDPRDEGLVRFERAVTRTAIIDGAAWAGDRFDDAQQDNVVRVLRVYYVAQRSGRDWSQWYFAVQQRPELFRRLVDAVAAFGQDAVAWLQRRVQLEFQGSPEYWPAAARRPLLLALDHARADRDWILQKLADVADTMLSGEDVSGRVDQAVDQAEAWLRVGERTRADAQLMHAVHLTLGVGYEKDDQVEGWIEWLRHVNPIEPDEAEARTEWFARAIVAMRDGGAGRDGEAAHALTEATFDWSAPAAFALTDWFFAEGIGTTYDLWASVAGSALRRGADPKLSEQLIATILIPLARSADSSLIQALIDHRFAVEGRRGALESAAALNAAFLRLAFDSMRPEWQRALANALASHGITPSEAALANNLLDPDGVHDHSNDVLELGEGDEQTTLSREQVRCRLVSVSAACELAAASTESYFRWEPLIEPLVLDASTEEVEQLARAFADTHYASAVLNLLVLRLVALGESDRAWEVGEQALAASNASGWSRWYDGGSRLHAFEALVAADQTRGRELLWRTLGNDIASARVRPSLAPDDFIRLAELLVNEVPVAQVWREVEDYVRALFSGTGIPEVTLPPLERELSQGAPEDSFVEFLLRLGAHPVTLVARGARRALAELIAYESPAVTRVFDRVQALPICDVETLLVAVEAVAVHEQLPEAIASRIAPAVSIPDLSVRALVHRILDASGSGAPLRSASEAAPLPPLYQVDLSGAPTPSDYSPDLADALEALELNRELVAALAASAGTGLENIVQRAAQLVEVLSSEPWLDLGDEQLRGLLAASSLRLPFLRMRRELGRRVLLRIAAEIDDARRLNADVAARVAGQLRPSDPHLVRLMPDVRPEEVVVDPCTDWNGAQWVQAGIEPRELATSTLDGRVVIGEITETRGFAWGVPTERRETLLVPATTDTAAYDRDGLIFSTFFTFMTLGHYARLQGINSEEIVVRQIGTTMRSFDWLALNPDVGLRHGWTVADDGLARWVDESGDVMVESVLWMDGIVDHGPPLTESYAAEGCLVIASRRAMEHLSQAPALARAVCVERQVQGDDATLQRRVELLPVDDEY